MRDFSSLAIYIAAMSYFLDVKKYHYLLSPLGSTSPSAGAQFIDYPRPLVAANFPTPFQLQRARRPADGDTPTVHLLNGMPGAQLHHQRLPPQRHIIY